MPWGDSSSNIIEFSVVFIYLPYLYPELLLETLFTSSHLLPLSRTHFFPVSLSKVVDHLLLFLNFFVIVFKHLLCFVKIKDQPFVFNLKALDFQISFFQTVLQILNLIVLVIQELVHLLYRW